MNNYFDYINVLIIPTDACNLNCEYCFHNEYLSQAQISVMEHKTLQRMLEITLPHYKYVNFIWHGGEPLCAGIEFYKKAINYQKEYNINNAIISNSLQTNMTLMDEEFATFFKNNNFNISTSFDGICNEDLRHNTIAYNKGRNIWKKFDKRCGVVMVISNKNVSSLIESYEYFKKENINYAMNPYTKSLFEDSLQSNLQLNDTDYSDNIIKFFDYWASDTKCNIQVKFFHEIIKHILFGEKNKCNINSCLGKWICIRPNGDITPCNRYFPPKYTFGNVHELSDVRLAFKSNGFNTLLSEAVERREKCKSCPIFEYCSGGCNNLALVYGGIEKSSYHLCHEMIRIYSHIKEKLNVIITSYSEESFLNPYLKNFLDKYIKTKQNN